MITFIGLILLCYGVAAFVVHAMYKWHVHRCPRSVKRVHYILITHNHENQMEWYLRALVWYTRFKGLALRVTLMDNESLDDTLAIARKMRKTHDMALTIIDAKEIGGSSFNMIEEMIEGEQQLCIDLRLSQGVTKIPYVQI